MKKVTSVILIFVLGFLITATAQAGKSCATNTATDIQQRAKPYKKIINTYSKKYGVDSRLITAVITTESCFKNKARSYKGAVGLMQLMPPAAKRWKVSNRRNPDQNIRGGTRYISHLIKRFNGNVKYALAAYNAGEGNVDKYNGIPPFKETRRYVKNVLLVYSKLGGYKLRVNLPPSKRALKRKKLMEKKKYKLDFSLDNSVFKKLLPWS